MKKAKQNKLKKAGYRVTDAQKFLGLSDAESKLIDLKIALTRRVRDERAAQALTQEDLACSLKSSQSRVAKIEAAAPDVTLDLILKALFVLGLSQKEVAKVVAAAA